MSAVFPSATSLSLLERTTPTIGVPRPKSGRVAKAAIMKPRGWLVQYPLLLHERTVSGIKDGNVRKSKAAIAMKIPRVVRILSTSCLRSFFERKRAEAMMGFHSPGSSFPRMPAGSMICDPIRMHSSKGISSMDLPLASRACHATATGA